MIALLLAAAAALPAGGAIDTGFKSADRRWGPAPCMIRVEYRSLLDYADGAAIGLAWPADCRIAVDDDLFWEERCAVAKHEDGHIHGQPHSTDPRNIMYPELNIIPRDCRRGTGIAQISSAGGRVLFHGHRNHLP